MPSSVWSVCKFLRYIYRRASGQVLGSAKKMETRFEILFRIISSSFLSFSPRNRIRLHSLSRDTTVGLIVFVVSPEDFNTPSLIGRYPDKVFSLHKIALEMGFRSQIVYHPWVSIRKNPDFTGVVRVERFIPSIRKLLTFKLNQFATSRDKDFCAWWSSLSLLEKYNFSVWRDFLDKTNPKIIFGIDLKENLIAASKTKNIPVIEVMHGVFTRKSIPLKRYSRGSYRIVPVDLFLAWDSHYSNLMQSVNISSRVVGHPNEEYAAELSQGLNPPEGSVIVTLAWGVENSMDPYGMLHMGLADKLLQSRAVISKVVFRLHPVAFEQNRKRMNQVTAWLKAHFPESSLSTPDKKSLFAEFSTASLHITEESSSFYEAGLLGVPTVFTSSKAYEDTPQEYKDSEQIYLWRELNDLDLLKLMEKKRVINGRKLDRELFKEIIYAFLRQKDS